MCPEGLSTQCALGCGRRPLQGTSGGVLAAVTRCACEHVGPALLRSLISVGSSRTQYFYDIVSIRRSASLVQLEGRLKLCGSVFLFLIFFALLSNITFLTDDHVIPPNSSHQSIPWFSQSAFIHITPVIQSTCLQNILYTGIMLVFLKRKPEGTTSSLCSKLHFLTPRALDGLTFNFPVHEVVRTITVFVLILQPGVPFPATAKQSTAMKAYSLFKEA